MTTIMMIFHTSCWPFSFQIRWKEKPLFCLLWSIIGHQKPSTSVIVISIRVNMSIISNSVVIVTIVSHVGVPAFQPRHHHVHVHSDHQHHNRLAMPVLLRLGVCSCQRLQLNFYPNIWLDLGSTMWLDYNRTIWLNYDSTTTELCITQLTRPKWAAPKWNHGLRLHACYPLTSVTLNPPKLWKLKSFETSHHLFSISVTWLKEMGQVSI